MSWNFRIIKQTWKEGEKIKSFLAIGEAFYTKSGKLKSFSPMTGVTGETIKELEWVLKEMKKALRRKPILYKPTPNQPSGE